MSPDDCLNLLTPPPPAARRTWQEILLAGLPAYLARQEQEALAARRMSQSLHGRTVTLTYFDEVQK